MLSQLQSLSPRRLIAMGLVVGGALIAVLLNHLVASGPLRQRAAAGVARVGGRIDPPR